jgi:sulfur carrier protein
MIQITVNGLGEQHSVGTSLQDILLSREITVESAKGIAVAVNDRIIRRADWNTVQIEQGANIEIVTARQGG